MARVGLRDAGLGGMPGNSSYRFTHEGVENPLQNEVALDRVLLGIRGRCGLGTKTETVVMLRLAWETVTPATG